MDDIRSGEDWTRNLLASSDGAWGDLPLIDTCSKDHKCTGDSAPRDLRGIKLVATNLAGTKGLADSCMDHSTIASSVLAGASLIGASMRNVDGTESLVLDGAQLCYADLTDADLTGASLEAADMTGAILEGTCLEEAVLIGASLRDVVVSEEPWYGFLQRRRWTRFGGEHQRLETLDHQTGSSTRKYIAGENLRWSALQRHPVAGQLWYVLTNCGRSPKRLLFWSVVIWLAFAVIYAGLPLPNCLTDTAFGEALCRLAPQFDWRGCPPDRTLIRPLYFSAVTMTTLGFGDVTPMASDWKAQTYAGIQAILGYVLLGSFVALLVHKTTH